ncbi:MAG: acyl-CoA dehydrogenase [Thermodesulfobacteriota bacterium]
MAAKFMSMRNLKFTLYDVAGIENLKNRAKGGYDEKSVNMILSAASDFAEKELHPLFEEMDRNSPELENQSVKVHPGVKRILEILGNDGWIAAPFSEKWGGENMPSSILHALSFIFCSANYSASVYSGLTTGAAKLIDSFGSEELKDKFIPPMLDGKWQGTMALTEPEAGTSLGDLSTAAYPMENGEYKIKGEKIFISAGDHDCVENIVHLMLARVDGAPEGVKGISLFAVPKFRINKDNEFEKNDVNVTQVFHKMGYRGAPITGLSMGEKDDCRGWLIGEENKGLKYMFQMMNGARLEVGTGAAAIAGAAFHAALDYSKGRKQGRKVSAGKSKEQIPIIEHDDVKRMLLFQRVVSEGGLCLILQCGKYEDMIEEASDEDKENYHLLLELLTPVAKSYSAEMGIQSTSLSIQCFGGYGYCEDFPVEQHFRDMRIHSIHEGTTGIQGMDLLGRKVVMKNGKALTLFSEEVSKTSEAARKSGLEKYADELENQLKTIVSTTQFLGETAMTEGAEAFLENSTLYLEMFGHFACAWQWLKMGVTALEKLNSGSVKKNDKMFYEGKLSVLKYCFSHELPKAGFLAQVITNRENAVLNTSTENFTL